MVDIRIAEKVNMYKIIHKKSGKVDKIVDNPRNPPFLLFHIKRNPDFDI